MKYSGKLICTICPQGCQLSWRNQREEMEIEGYRCSRGKAYGLAEITNPVRTLTTTVKVENGLHPLAPVRSTKPLPKGYLHEAMGDLALLSLSAPLEGGSIVLVNWKDLKVDFITTRNIPSKN